MIYELRIYRIAAGGMQKLHTRFEALGPVFERLGIHCIGQWHTAPAPGAIDFVYMLSYADLAQREAQWAPFVSDPEWRRIYAATGGGAVLLRYDLLFLRPNATSRPDTAFDDLGPAQVNELLLQEVIAGGSPAYADIFGSTIARAVQRHGGQVLLTADLMSGVRMPMAVSMLSWPDAAARNAAWEALGNSPDWEEGLARRTIEGLPLLGRTETYLLKPRRTTGPAKEQSPHARVR